VRDVTGAGDIVISIIAHYYKYLEKSNLIHLAAWMGTHSVKHVGTYVIKKSDILEGCKMIRDTKLLTVDNLIHLETPFVITNGCFDIVHEGHIALFKYCKSIVPENGSVIVALNSDDSVRRLKGSTRPINSLQSRIALLNQIESIDWIVVFDEDTPYELYSKIKPTVLVKGGDYAADSLIGREFCKQIQIFKYVPGKSTTGVIEQIRNLK
jgi:D-beta-D-heptose 7-phosphate kinase/D-beta-D-heptose 1-phosphate adenosyltransferase